MADFCAQCSKDLGAPEGWSDFNKADPLQVQLCEGCGFVKIEEGKCVDPKCKKHGNGAIG